MQLEYKVVIIDSAVMSSKLNELGKEGWEFIQAVPLIDRDDLYRCFFKRLI